MRRKHAFKDGTFFPREQSGVAREVGPCSLNSENPFYVVNNGPRQKAHNGKGTESVFLDKHRQTEGLKKQECTARTREAAAHLRKCDSFERHTLAGRQHPLKIKSPARTLTLKKNLNDYIKVENEIGRRVLSHPLAF